MFTSLLAQKFWRDELGRGLPVSLALELGTVALESLDVHPIMAPLSYNLVEDIASAGENLLGVSLLIII